MEKWKPIKGCDGYSVSNHGRFRSEDRFVKTEKGGRNYKGRLLTPVPQSTNKSNRTYQKIAFGRSTSKWAHRVVAKAFIPNPDNKPQVDHIDGDGLNNHADNLRWATQSENIRNNNTHVDHSSFVFINGKTMRQHSKELGSKNGHLVWKRLQRGWCEDCATSIVANSGTCNHD